MKTIINILLGLVLAISFNSCDENESLDHLNVTSVQSFYTPLNNDYVQLQSSAGAAVVFEWEQAKAEDGGLVMYEVAFDLEGGDFSSPVYKLSSDNNGVFNRATIEHKTLNQITAYAGIGSSETGKLIWTVFSSKGINEVKANETRTIELTRLAGFADIPLDLYVTGEGSESASDLSKALQMKPTAPGEFEIYTQLVAGVDYHFVDRNEGSPRTFYIDGELLKEGGSSSVEATSAYRINLDFNVGNATITKVNKIELYFCPTDQFLFEMPYVANGVFTATNQPIEFKQEGWGRDERYKIRMTVENMEGETSDEWWGTPNKDNSPNADEPLEYWYLYPVNNSQWDGKFKFASEMDMAYVDVNMIFSASEIYTHEIVKVGDQ